MNQGLVLLGAWSELLVVVGLLTYWVLPEQISIPDFMAKSHQALCIGDFKSPSHGIAAKISCRKTDIQKKAMTPLKNFKEKLGSSIGFHAVIIQQKGINYAVALGYNSYKVTLGDAKFNPTLKNGDFAHINIGTDGEPSIM